MTAYNRSKKRCLAEVLDDAEAAIQRQELLLDSRRIAELRRLILAAEGAGVRGK